MICYYIVLFITQILHSIVGFGSTSIGIPFLSLALGAERSVLLLSTAGALLSLLIAITQRKDILYRELFIIILTIFPFMPIGFLLFSRLRPYDAILRLIMGTVVCLVASRELWRRMVKNNHKDPPKGAVYTALGVGAILEGMISMGAALINFYALSRMKDKRNFRATMVAVWVFTNTVSTLFRAFILKAYSPPIWTGILYAIPLIFLAFFVGNKLHHKIPNERFANVVYMIQLVSGVISIGGGVMLLL